MNEGDLKEPVRGKVINWVLIASTQNDGMSRTIYGFIIKNKNPSTTLSTCLDSSFPKILEITYKTGLMSTANISKEKRFPSRENLPDLGARKEVTWESSYGDMLS